jgi:hypothetical protein
MGVRLGLEIVIFRNEREYDFHTRPFSLSSLPDACLCNCTLVHFCHLVVECLLRSQLSP